MSNERLDDILSRLDRIAMRWSGPRRPQLKMPTLMPPTPSSGTPAPVRLQPVPRVNRVEMVLLHGIDRVRDILVDNTVRFANGLPANNALLWGARGMGKSSLVKASHAAITAQHDHTLKLIEIHREDIEGLPVLMGLLRDKVSISLHHLL